MKVRVADMGAEERGEIVRFGASNVVKYEIVFDDEYEAIDIAAILEKLLIESREKEL